MMEGCDRTKIEADGVHSPTDPLSDEFCHLKYYSRTRVGLEGVSLNCHNSSSTDTSSIAVANYDHYNTSISHKQSTSETIRETPTGHFIFLLFIADTESLSPALPTGHVDNDTISIQNLLYLLPTETPTGHGGNDKQSLDRFCFSCNGFSQSTACNAIRFGECSSTSLDRLWYLYSYIYRPTRTISNGIYIFLNSRHPGPLWLSPSVKHTTTPSASLSLFTTSSFTTQSTLQLSILLESASASSLSITSGTFFVNFLKSIIFLYLAGVGAVGRDIGPVDRDTDFNNTNNPLDCCTTTGPVYTVQYVIALLQMDLSYDTATTTTTILRRLKRLKLLLNGTTNILRSRQLELLSCGASVVNSVTSSVAIMYTYSSSCVLPNNNPSSSNTFSPVFDGRTGTTTILRLRQLKLISNSTYPASGTVQAIVTTILRSKRLTPRTFFVDLSLSSINAVDAIGRDTIFHLIDQGKVGYLYHLQILLFNLQDASSSLSTLLLILRKYDEDKNDNNGSTSADEALYDYYSGDTAVSIALSSIVIVSVLDETMDSVLMMKSYDQFDTAFTSASHALPSYDTDSSRSSSSSSSLYDNNYTDGTNDNIMSSSIVDTATTVSVANNKASSAGNDSTTTAILTAQVYASSLYSESSNKYVKFFSAVADSVTRTTTSYMSPSSYNNNNDIDSLGRTLFYGRNDSSYYHTGTTVLRPVYQRQTITTIFDGCTDNNDFDLYFDTVFDGRTGNNDNKYGDITVSISNIVTKTYDTIYGLYFNSMIAIIVAVAPAVAVEAPFVAKTKTYATIFITLFCSHIIDQGSVLYLIQQILLYNQQYVFSCAAVTTDMTCNTAVLVITKISSAIYDEDSSTLTIVTTAVRMKTVFHELPSAIHDGIISAGNDSPATVTTTTQVYLSSSSSSSSEFYAIYDEDSSAGNDSPLAITMKTRVTSSTIHTFLSISNAESNTDAMAAPAVMVEPYDMTFATNVPVIMKISSAGNDSSAAVMIMTTAIIMMSTVFHELPFAIHDDTVYLAVIDAESSTDITNTIALYELPSYDIDTEPSAVSVADEATTTDSCHSSNYFSLISSRQFNHITSVPSTLMSLHRTLYLILTSLLPFNSINWVCPYFDF